MFKDEVILIIPLLNAQSSKNYLAKYFFEITQKQTTFFCMKTSGLPSMYETSEISY